MTDAIQISVVVPVSERLDDVLSMYAEYKKAVESITNEFEFIYVFDGVFFEAVASLRELQKSNEPIRIIQFARWFGEATALTAGFESARGNIIVSLPAYYQVDRSVIPELVKALDSAEVAIAVRNRKSEKWFKRFQGRVFNKIVSRFSEGEFHDLGCNARALKRFVADEMKIYGDQHRFFPILAKQLGFRVVEVEADKDARDIGSTFFSPGIYMRRILDIATVFFLTKFTKKPLRFFGLVGSAVATAGGLIVLLLIIQRIFFNMDLGDRPALIIGSLLVVLGVQLFATGLIGELIIFTHARHIKEYQIDDAVNLEIQK